MQKILFICLLTLKIRYISSQPCVYVRELQVSHRKSDNDIWTKTKVTGCINNVSLDSQIVSNIKIGCESVSLPKLEKHFISNLESLRKILILACHIETVEPGAFLNLPKLAELDIQGNPFLHISSGVFNVLPNLSKLYIRFNKVSQIEDGAFANLPNLEIISLEQNNLNHLKREWFTNTSNVLEVWMPGNSIEAIPQSMFRAWKRLHWLTFSANAISHIGEGAFTNIAPVIIKLDLHSNRLTSLSSNIYSESVFIERLEISANLFNYIPEDFLTKIRIAYINIFSNPFKCPCLEKLHKILRNEDVIVGTDSKHVKICQDFDVPACGYSVNETSTCIETIDRNLTKKMISYMKKIGYDSVRDKYHQQCAMFDYDDPKLRSSSSSLSAPLQVVLLSLGFLHCLGILFFKEQPSVLV